MSISAATRRFSFFGTSAAAAVALAALTVPLTPAKAQAFFGFDFGPFALGVGAPPAYYSYPYNYSPTYYNYPPAYAYNYYSPTYYPPYYSQYYPQYYSGYYPRSYWYR